MKIPPNMLDAFKGVRSTDSTTPNRVAGEGKPAAVAGVTQGTTAEFTSKIKALRDEIASGDVVDMAKVERISKAIADGTFQVDAEAVADKMLGSAAEMLGKRS